MLTLSGGSKSRFCDGISRRDFLTIGALGVGGLSLADLLRLKANGAVRAESAHKSVIMVYLPGGPSHIDMYDLKPDAPAEYRGEFKPIQTNVPGLQICELMPLQATIADKLAVIRGLKTHGAHNAYELLSGFRAGSTETITSNRPVFGAVVSRLRHGQSSVPPYVSLGDHRLLVQHDDPEVSTYLGPAHRPFRASGPGLANLRLPQNVTLDRLEDRKTLLRSFDNLRSDLDRTGTLAGIDACTVRALELVTSSKVRDAFDLCREPDKTRGKYGFALSFLLARRLVEAGVSVVTLPTRPAVTAGGAVIENGGAWDTHGRNFVELRMKLPLLDRAVYALVTDLYERGLDQDVAVVLWGEFGRTPRIGGSHPDGRDHWPEAGFALLSGGGMRTGQVIGATDARAERSLGIPCTPRNVLATLYDFMGIDPGATLPDHSGRPQYLLDERETIAALR